jgi:hypothetical protein
VWSSALDGTDLRIEDEAQVDPGQSAQARRLASLADGTLLVTGYGRDATATENALVRARSPSGSWAEEGRWVATAGGAALGWSVATGASGTFVATEEHNPTGLRRFWVWRRAGPGAFMIADTYVGASDQEAVAEGVGSFDSGLVVAAGYATSGGVPAFIIRRDTGGGADGVFDTVDLFSLVASGPARARTDVLRAPSGYYVGGSAEGPEGTAHWIVRRSTTTDAGTWETVDDHASGGGAEVRGLGVSADGRVFAVGEATDASGAHRWLVRVSDDGVSFTTTDEYVWDAAGHTVARAVAFDASGGVWVAGYGASTPSGPTTALVRRLACPVGP